MYTKAFIFFIIFTLSGCFKGIDSQFQMNNSFNKASIETGYVTRMGTGLTKKTKKMNETKFSRHVIEYSEKCDNNICGLKHDVNQISKIEEFIESKNTPNLVVFFIHGWNHNASEESRNYKYFPDLLSRIDDQLSRKKIIDSNFIKPDVVGVYIGWPGLAESKFPNALSVGNRACAADKISLGLKSSCNYKTYKNSESEMRRDILNLIKKVNSKNLDSKILIIGHSFGGRIVSNMFLQDLNQSILNKKDNILGENVLISTINPAIGYKRFIDVLENADENSTPYWINFTSKEDKATKYLFPLARSFLILKDDGLKTIGHKNKYKTHILTMEYVTFDEPFGCNYKNLEFYSCFSPLRDKSVESKISASHKWFNKNHSWYIPFFERDGLSFAYQPYKPFRGCKENEQSVHNCIDVELYKLNLKIANSKQINKIFYNIEVDSNIIGFNEEHKDKYRNIDAFHNGYISTVLLSLLIGRIY